MNMYGPRFKHHRTKADHVYTAGRGGKGDLRRYWKRVARRDGKREIEARLWDARPDHHAR